MSRDTTDENREPRMRANPAVPAATPVAAAASGALEQIRPGEGHGRRLTAAFEALEGFPALAESRNRLLALVGGHRVPIAQVVEAVESDIALVVAVMRVANDVPARGVAKVENIVDAVRILSPEAVQQLAERVRTFDFFERSAVWDSMPDRFRLHALATRAAADLLASEIGYPDRDRLIVASLLHDVGKLVLMHAYPGYPESVHRDARTPEERITRERRELGVDHAAGISRVGPAVGAPAGGAKRARASRTRRRPRGGGWRAGPPLGAAEVDRDLDRAPPLRRNRRRRGARSARRHPCALRPRCRRLARGHAARRAHRRRRLR